MPSCISTSLIVLKRILLHVRSTSMMFILCSTSCILIFLRKFTRSIAAESDSWFSEKLNSRIVFSFNSMDCKSFRKPKSEISFWLNFIVRIFYLMEQPMKGHMLRRPLSKTLLQEKSISFRRLSSDRASKTMGKPSSSRLHFLKEIYRRCSARPKSDWSL